MSGKAFFDTNVFVYMWLNADPVKKDHAAKLITSSVRSRHCISAQVAQEFFNVACRKFPLQMNEAAAEEYLHLVLAAFHWVPSEISTLSSALTLRTRYKLPWYDSLIVAAALQAECRILYSEDFQAGQVFEGTLTVVNPFAVQKS